MSMRTSNITATIAAGANQKLSFTLVVPNNPMPILRYFVVADPADGTLFPVPYTVSQQLDSSGTLGSGLALVSPQDIELYQDGSWVASNAYYVVSGAGTSLLTTNFAYSGSTRDLSALLAAMPDAPYTTVPVTVAIPPLTGSAVQLARATLSTACLSAGIVIPTSAVFSVPLAMDGTGTLQLVPNSMLTAINPAISSDQIVWQVQVAGVTLPIQVPDAGGALTDLIDADVGGQLLIGFSVPPAMARLYAEATFI